MSNQDSLVNLRKKISEVLGEGREKNYFFEMKQWFRAKSTKEEFDSKARNIFPNNFVHLHNEFLLAILTKCQLGAASHNFQSNHIKPEQEYQVDTYVETPPKRIRASPQMYSGATSQSTFEPIDLIDVVPSAVPRETTAIADAGAGYYSQSLYMLDAGPLKGRILLCAWDHGLVGSSEEVISLIQEAVKQFLKNILTSLITKRKSFRLREGKFVHSIGTPAINPWIRNANNMYDLSSTSFSPFHVDDPDEGPTSMADLSEQNDVHLSSCGPCFDPPRGPITCFDLYKTLKIDRSLITSHSVYSLNMERISSKLWHPSTIELEQEEIARKEAAIRHCFKQQRSVLTRAT